MTAIYRKLKETGVPAKMATHGGTYEFVLRDASIPYEKIEPDLSHKDCQHCLKVVTKPWISLYDKAALKKTVRCETEYFKSVNAKAVISGFQLSLTLSARSAMVPLVVTHLGSFVPPVFEKEMFSCSEIFDNIFAKLIPQKKIDRLFAKLLLYAPFQQKVFNNVADELGVQKIRSFFDLMMGDLTLVTDVPEILQISEEEIEGWKPLNNKKYRPEARLKYAGAIYAELFGSVPEDVLSFLKTDKPVVYVAMASGKMKDLKLVYDTLSKMDVRSVFCSLVYPGMFKSTENILVADFLPSHLVMPLCDLAIIHGGQGSVQTAIASGIPLIGFPIQPEQNFNLKQVERHGAGLCLSLRSLRKGYLQDAVNRILKNKRYKTSMEQLQAWQSNRDGALEVAKVMSEVAGNRERQGHLNRKGQE